MRWIDVARTRLARTRMVLVCLALGARVAAGGTASAAGPLRASASSLQCSSRAMARAEAPRGGWSGAGSRRWFART
jgi:hypothetical protein